MKTTLTLLAAVLANASAFADHTQFQTRPALLAPTPNARESVPAESADAPAFSSDRGPAHFVVPSFAVSGSWFSSPEALVHFTSDRGPAHTAIAPRRLELNAPPATAAMPTDAASSANPKS